MPRHIPVGAFKNGTPPTKLRLGFRCQVELRNLTYNYNLFGAFKNGTHATKLRLGFRCQVELRNLTYNCNLIGAFKKAKNAMKLFACKQGVP